VPRRASAGVLPVAIMATAIFSAAVLARPMTWFTDPFLFEQC
jgi:hypothetical protein